MEITRKDGVSSVHFESLSDLMDTDYQNSTNKGMIRRILAGHGHRFIGARTSQDVINNALHGSSETLEILKGYIKTFDQQIGEMDSTIEQVVKRKRKRVRGKQGDELDIHRVYRGQFDTAWSFRRHVEADSHHSLYTLFIDVGGNASVNWRDSLWRAAVAVKVADDLLLAGKSVRVIVGSSATGVTRSHFRDTYTTDIVVKNYNEPLSLERLAAMSHLGFHRTFNFSARCHLPENVIHNMGSTSGYLQHNPPVHVEKEVEAGATRYIYVNRSTCLQSAIRNLKEVYHTIKTS